ncbi:hypothetical protein HMN09_00120800 [Mycena chlorophos]|uniref:Uncharacterized protein n=1 Tax=Mycena chlorophos TaxID=658473 RepID=A0A8H6WLV1_MYCCL|nr:hypothetical protein HMN09_00120800 [Mycena chlorophos]
MPISLDLVLGPMAEKDDIETQCAKVEWICGLKHHSLRPGLNTCSSDSDPLIEILEDPHAVPIVEERLMYEIYLKHAGYPQRQPRNISEVGVRLAPPIHRVQNSLELVGDGPFQYVVLRLDAVAATGPQTLSSTLAPHLTLGSSYLKLVPFVKQHGNGWTKQLVGKLLTDTPERAQLQRTLSRSLDFMEATFRTWINAVPMDSFLLDLPPTPEISDDSESEEEEEEEEVKARDPTPPRRLLPEEQAWDINEYSHSDCL